MALKSKPKSNRGGKRPGAGRPLGATSHRSVDRRGIGVEIALGGLERALKAYEVGDEDCFTPEQGRWHLAMVIFGVPTETIAEALLKPGTSDRFRDAVIAAIGAVKAEASS